MDIIARLESDSGRSLDPRQEAMAHYRQRLTDLGPALYLMRGPEEGVEAVWVDVQMLIAHAWYGEDEDPSPVA